MTKDVTLHLDEFAERTLGRFTRQGTAGDAAAVRTACLYYLADKPSGRAAWRIPEFAERASRPRGWSVSLDDATWEAVTGEAELQRVRPEVLVVHALLYFLADLDSGRIASLLEHALHERE